MYTRDNNTCEEFENVIKELKDKNINVLTLFGVIKSGYFAPQK